MGFLMAPFISTMICLINCESHDPSLNLPPVVPPELSLVRIETRPDEPEEEDDWGFSGSGTLVTNQGIIKSSADDYVVVTAYHVIENEPEVRVCGTLDPAGDCDVIPRWDFYVVEGQDIALLVTNTRIAAPARRGRGLKLHDEVIVQGFPADSFISAPGTVVGNEHGWIKVLSYCDYGSSGGGVFKKGKLVGVAVAIRLDIFIPVHQICYTEPLPLW